MKGDNIMAVELSTGRNFVQCRMKYKLPSGKSDNTIYLVSNSFEYDIQIIKSMPFPKIDYRKIIFPCKIIDTINGRPFKFIKSHNDLMKYKTYLNNQRLNPNITPIDYPYPSMINDNIYIPMSDVIKHANQLLSKLSKETIRENIFNIFLKIFNHFKFTRNRVIFIDVDRYPLYKSMNSGVFKTDIINALLCAYSLNDESQIKRLPFTIIFRNSEMDYKMDLNTFDKRDTQRLRMMLETIGTKNPPVEKETDDLDSDISKDDLKRELNTISDDSKVDDRDEIRNDENDRKDHDKMTSEKDINDAADKLSKENKNSLHENEDEIIDSDNNEEEVQRIQASNFNIARSLQSRIASISSRIEELRNDNVSLNDPNIHNETKSLYNSKMLQNYAILHRRAMGISDDAINNVDDDNRQRLSDALTGNLKNAPVESQILSAAAKEAAAESVPVDEKSVDASITSPRELQIRKQVGQIKLNNVTFETLTSKGFYLCWSY